MAMHLNRSIDRPIRAGLTTVELWQGPDKGLIGCWERGRAKRVAEPELAAQAKQGELVTLAWKRKSLQYLATWQGLRGDDLKISFVEEVTIVCAKTGKTVVFKAGHVD
ncbi:MAG TPA: hypothetical protein VGG64_13060 [Pirellulales bacterium]